MQDDHSLVEKVRYYSSVSTLYLLTLLFAWVAIHPAARHNVILAKSVQNPALLAPGNSNIISGRPTRIVIPDSHVDLPVDAGYYDQTQGGWTLSGYRAQYAMISTLANNFAGDTFIYGHNNNYVFGALRHVTPAAGAEALLYTENGHIFAYSFDKAYRLPPDDTSILSYRGPAIMTVQTCTGSLNEWRTMYQFDFTKVIQ